MAKKNVVAKATTEKNAKTEEFAPDAGDLFKKMKGYLKGDIRKEAFDTKVLFTPWFSKEKGISGLVIKFGSELQYQIQVSAREKGKVSVTTDFEKYCKPFESKFDAKAVVSEATKI